MFRIKNIRGSTVGKANNLSPQVPQYKPEPKKQTVNNKINPQPQLNKINDPKIKLRPVSRNNKKVILPGAKDRTGNAKLNKIINDKLEGKFRQSKRILKPQIPEEIQQKKEEERRYENQPDYYEEKEQKKESQPPGYLSNQTIEILQMQKKLKEMERMGKEKETFINQQLIQMEKKQKQRQERQKLIQLERRKKQQEERQQKQRLEKQKQERAKRDLERIMKRRAEREAERKRKKQMEEKRKELQERISNNQQSSGLGGMMHLNDPLAHFQFADLIMDAQINKIIKTSFAQFPNGSAIEIQKQELSRINDSYNIIRDDPHNNLKEGLKGYRIQIFNRIGELIMQAQRQGYSNQNFSLIQTDSRNPDPFKDVSVMRGLPKEKIKHFAKQKFQENDGEDCPICLDHIQKGTPMSQLNCGHNFHEKCLEEWLQGNANCPSCRHNIKFPERNR